MRITALLCALVGLTASSLLAEDLNLPPWDQSLPWPQTSTAWQFAEMFKDWPSGTPAPNPTWPSDFWNNFGATGEPCIEWPEQVPDHPDYTVAVTIQVIDYWPPGSPGGTPGIPTPTVHIGVYGPDGLPADGVPVPVSIWIPNSKDDNLYKVIYWQVTSDKSPTPTGDSPTTDPPGTPSAADPPQTPHGGGNWYTYGGVNTISPNPDGETLTFMLVNSTNIEEIVVKTVCMPEPATLGLLAAGAGLAFLRRRR